MRTAMVVMALVAAGLVAVGCDQEQKRDDQVEAVDMATLEGGDETVAAAPVVEEETPPPPPPPVTAYEEPVATPGAYPAETPAYTPPATTPAGQTHTVQRGETLWLLAVKYYGDGQQWRRIHAANQAKIPNVNDMPVGTVLVIP